MHSDRHTVGDADLFNDQVGKIGKNRHRLRLDQEMVSFCSVLYFTTLPSSRLRKNHNVAGLTHIVATESERDAHFMPKTETSTHGHVMLHKSDFRHFMLQFVTLYACCKVASGLSHRTGYAAQVGPENG